MLYVKQENPEDPWKVQSEVLAERQNVGQKRTGCRKSPLGIDERIRFDPVLYNAWEILKIFQDATGLHHSLCRKLFHSPVVPFFYTVIQDCVRPVINSIPSKLCRCKDTQCCIGVVQPTASVATHLILVTARTPHVVGRVLAQQ